MESPWKETKTEAGRITRFAIFVIISILVCIGLSAFPLLSELLSSQP